MLPSAHNDDVSHRLLEIVRPSQTLAAAAVAIQGYPFLATGGYANDDNNQNSASGFVSDDASSAR